MVEGIGMATGRQRLSTSSHANKGQHLQKIGSCRVVRVQMLNDFWLAPPWPARPKPACCFPTKTCGLTRDGLASRLPVSPPALGLRITKSRYLPSPLLSLQPSGPQNTAPSRAEGLNIPGHRHVAAGCRHALGDVAWRLLLPVPATHRRRRTRGSDERGGALLTAWRKGEGSRHGMCAAARGKPVDVDVLSPR